MALSNGPKRESQSFLKRAISLKDSKKKMKESKSKKKEDRWFSISYLIFIGFVYL